MPGLPRTLIRMSPPIGDCDFFQKMRSHEEIGDTDGFAQRVEAWQGECDRFSSADVRAVLGQYCGWWRSRDE